LGVLLAAALIQRNFTSGMRKAKSLGQPYSESPWISSDEALTHPSVAFATYDRSRFTSDGGNSRLGYCCGTLGTGGNKVANQYVSRDHLRSVALIAVFVV
jgi:hypothetical protein